MSTYNDHLSWMGREIDKAFRHLNGLLAERDGFLAARTGETGNPYKKQIPTDEHLAMRYQMGVDAGKTKLMVEDVCGKNR